jgi:hypothetical protein
VRLLLRAKASNLLALSAIVAAPTLHACADPMEDDGSAYAAELEFDEEADLEDQTEKSGSPCLFFGGQPVPGAQACAFLVRTNDACTPPGKLKRADWGGTLCLGPASTKLATFYRPHTAEQAKWECWSQFWQRGVTSIDGVALGKQGSSYFFECSLSNRGTACQARGGVLRTVGTRQECLARIPVLRTDGN